MVCQCCQQPRLGETPPNITQTFDFPEDEVEWIDAEVRRIHDHIDAEARRVRDHAAQLKGDCASLLRRRNFIQSSTGSLPQEVLSLIFQYACPTPDFFKEWIPHRRPPRTPNSTSHLTLSSVSSHWRQVVLSTPQLWSALRAGSFSSWMVRWEDFFHTWFDRSGGVALQVAISKSFSTDDKLNIILSPELDTFLLRNQRRIRSFSLETGDPQGWVPLISNLTELTSLSIMCKPTCGTWQTKFTLSFPADVPLTQFRLYGPLKRTRLDLPWLTITMLDLSRIGVDTCMKLLLGCPNLVEFRYSDPAAAEEPHDSSILTEPVELPNLESFSWVFILPQELSAWNIDLCEYVRVPNLKTFRWNESCGDWWDPGPTADFLNALPLSITHLEFIDVSYASHLLRSNLLQCIHHNSQVESVAMEICGPSFIKGILRTLMISADEGMVVFPNLKEIRIDGCCSSDVIDVETGELLVDVLNNRWGGGYIDQFTLVIDDVNSLQWEPSVMQDLYELFEDDLDLTVILAGTPLVPRHSENPS